jgi:phenylacetate-CoA ligase
LICRCPGLAPHYEIEVTRPNRLDEIRIVVEARAGLAESAQVAAAALLSAMLKDHIGISAQIQIAANGSMPRSSGKAVHVHDRRRETDA